LLRGDQGEKLRPYPLISIITVTFNDISGLKATTESLRRQRYSHLEHIVIDGASTDDTPAFLKNYVAPYAINWISEEDDGIYDAMNKGAALADGELLLFLNSGDVLPEPDILDFVAQKWKNGTWTWGYGAMNYVDSNGTIVGSVSQHPFKKRCLQLGFQFVPHQAMYISKDLFSDLGGYSLKYPLNSEQELAMRAAELCTPEVWEEALCDFLTGGAHSSMSNIDREFSYHQMRVDMRRQILASTFVDLLFSILVASYRESRKGVRQIRRSLRDARRNQPKRQPSVNSVAPDANDQ
jgi:glycosyltransferase involved in cell wall biosynthesis